VHVTVTGSQCKMAPTPGEDVNCELTVTDECMVRPDAGHSKA
jgi:hypothetical protein